MIYSASLEFSLKEIVIQIKVVGENSSYEALETIAWTSVPNLGQAIEVSDLMDLR